VYIFQVRQTLQRQKELKMAKLHPKEPPKPKEITVIAGTYFYTVKNTNERFQYPAGNPECHWILLKNQDFLESSASDPGKKPSYVRSCLRIPG
jgi:hypothetical protein